MHLPTRETTVPVKIKPSGPRPAAIMIIGEAPGAEEEVQGIPFVGSSGIELTRMLHEAGIVREECFLTNVCKYRPPGNDIETFFLDSKCTKPNELVKEGISELLSEIGEVKPKLILAMGNTPLWALTNQRGITKWRGSMLSFVEAVTQHRALMMPTFHPALIMREWSYRAITIHDLKRAAHGARSGGWPQHRRSFLVRSSFTDTMDCLGTLLNRAKTNLVPLASDLETRSGYIACHGIAWSEHDAISIPFMCVERPDGFWSLDEEVAIWDRMKRLLSHPNVEVIGQNYLYDAQYMARRWGYVPRLKHDTMWMQHVAFAALPKGLDFMSSMYREHHVYWKDEGKNWNKSMPEEQLWAYNCEDSIATFEIRFALEKVLRQLNLWHLYQFQMRLWRPILDCMLRGVRIDHQKRGHIAEELLKAIQQRQGDLEHILGHQFNVRSPKQMMNLFYEQLKCKVIRSRQTGHRTCDEDALIKFAEREPLLKPLTQRIIDVRSIGVMLSNVIEAECDADGRLRSSFSPTKETYRWGSGKNAFGGGTNMQNWTKGDEDKEPAAVKGYPIPNVRKLVQPDLDKELCSIDLTGADAQTVAWESGDEDLKLVFRENRVKLHAHNAKIMFPGKAITGYEQPYYDLTRTGVHLCNFVGGADALALAMGFSRWEAQRFQDAWFSAHPKILDWHNRIWDQIQRTRKVRNAFGYERYFFERIDGILPEAIAWLAQSTTACIANRAWVAMAESDILKRLGLELLFQVHDEIVFQYPSHNRETILRYLHPIIHIEVPYPEPLIIPWGLKVSTCSWGECEKADWPDYPDLLPRAA